MIGQGCLGDSEVHGPLLEFTHEGWIWRSLVGMMILSCTVVVTIR